MVRALCFLLLPSAHGEEEGGLLQVNDKKEISLQLGSPGKSLSEVGSRAAQKQQQLALLVERIGELETAVGKRVDQPHDCKSGKCKTIKVSSFDETVVKTALDSNSLVIGELSQEHQEQQILIDQSNNGIVSCNAQLDRNFNGAEGVNFLKTQMEHKRKAHESCRLQEVVYVTEGDTVCEEYYRYADITQAGHPPCLCADATAKPSQNTEQYSTEALTDADAISDCYQQNSAWVKQYEVLVEKQLKCKNAERKCQYTKGECAEFQVNFEEAYCAYGSKLQETCSDLASCLSPEGCKPLVQQRLDLIAKLKLWETAQKAVFKGVQQMNCLMSLMSTGYAPSTDDLVNCQNLVVDTSHLDLTFPYDVVGPESCDDSQVPYLPGQVAWKEAEYSDQSWGGYVQTVTSCEATEPVYTTSAEPVYTTGCVDSEGATWPGVVEDCTRKDFFVWKGSHNGFAAPSYTPLFYGSDEHWTTVKVQEGGWQSSCVAYVNTGGRNCKDWCGDHGLQCVKAMDDAHHQTAQLSNSLEGEGYAATDCSLYKNGHQRQTTEENGCLQHWGTQICACN